MQRRALSTADSSPSSDTDDGSERATSISEPYVEKEREARAGSNWSPSKSRPALRAPRPLPPTPGGAPAGLGAAPATATASDPNDSLRSRAHGMSAAAGARWRSEDREPTQTGTASSQEVPPRHPASHARSEPSHGGVDGAASAQGVSGDEAFSVRLAEARADAARARRAQRDAEEELESVKRQLTAQKAAAAREAQRARALEEELALARSEATEARENLKQATKEYAGDQGHARRASDDLVAARDRALQEAREARESRDVLSRELERASAAHGEYWALSAPTIPFSLSRSLPLSLQPRRRRRRRRGCAGTSKARRRCELSCGSRRTRWRACARSWADCGLRGSAARRRPRRAPLRCSTS